MRLKIFRSFWSTIAASGLHCLIACCLLFTALPAVAATLTVPDTVISGQAFVVAVQADAAELQHTPSQHATDRASLFLEWGTDKVPVFLQRAEHSESGGGANELFTGHALLAIPMDTTKKTYEMRLLHNDGRVLAWHTVRVQLKKYPEQHLTVKHKYVELPKPALERHYAEKARAQSVKALRTPKQMWELPFIRPVPGTVSSPFGVRRFFNGKPRKPHSGVDFRGPTGTPIKATAAGTVKIVDDFYFSGKIIYIDHGAGVVSVYCHLSEMLVKEGQHVVAGEVIGKVGATGRVTGPHLHFGVAVQGTMVDALPLFESN